MCTFTVADGLILLWVIIMLLALAEYYISNR